MNVRRRSKSLPAGALATLAALVFVVPASPANSLVAAVSIGTPADSLAIRDRREQGRQQVSADASPVRAMLLSTAATALPVVAGILVSSKGHLHAAGAGLVGAGILIGPATGYFDAGLAARGTRGLLIRSGIAAASFVVAAVVLPMQDGELEDAAGAAGVLYAGAAFTTVVAIADCAMAGPAVSHASRLAVEPMLDPIRGGGGVRVGVRF
jgi:hypothetical protein